MPASATLLQAGLNLKEIAANGGDNDIARGNLRTPVLRSCRVAATANVASLSGTTTIDGVALAAGDPVLLTAQTTGSQNGPWVVQSGAWTRPGDYTSALGSLTHARSVLVWAGNTTANKGLWTLSTVPATVDTTATTWTAPPTGGGGGGTNYQTAQVGGSAQTQRPAFNFIQGTGVTITPADNAGQNRTDFTFATASGASSPNPQPSDQNLLGWSVDPATLTATFTPTAGVLYLFKIPVRASLTFAKAWVSLVTAGTGATSLANCFLGLYIISGSNLQLIGSTPDQSTNWASGGNSAKSDNLTVQGGQSLTQAVNVWGGLLVGTQSTTNVTFRMSGGNVADPNVGLVAGTDALRAGSTGTAQTALPTLPTIASLANQKLVFVGVS